MASQRTFNAIHILTIVAHFFMIVLAFVAFAATGFHNVSNFNGDEVEMRDSMTTVAMPWATFGVGIINLFLSIIVFILLYVLRKGSPFRRYANNHPSTFSPSHTSRTATIRYTIACLFAAFTFCTDIGISSWTATRVGRETVLAAPVAAGIIAGLLAAVKGWVDFRSWREEKSAVERANGGVNGIVGGNGDMEPKPIVMVPGSLRFEA
ncbi:MAG: hypothetical protein Q9160_007523 [Pyrenula sp. 1 TL-2023]